MLNNILRYSGGILLGLIIGFLIGNAFAKPEYLKQDVFIKPDTIIQHTTEPLILKPDADLLEYYVSELNKYRTEAGSITISSNRIHASLYKRSWSAEYITRKYNNIVSIYGGQVWGVAYSRRVYKNLYAGIGVFSSGLAGSLSLSF